MKMSLSSLWVVLIAGLLPLGALGQSQTCPVNIDFASGDLSDWSALTGLLGGGTQDYTSNTAVTIIPEYSISATGIQIVTSPGIDPYGGFPTIPTINGYTYKTVVKLGSTATSYDLQGNRQSNPGGFTRSITYKILVPAGSPTDPYTMTYAYAMVLENGTHNSDQQPMFRATLSTAAGVIDCASPKYYLPTLNDAGQGGGPGGQGGASVGATLDSAAALAEGFTVSPRPFLSHSGAAGNQGTLLYDVWTKGWREVTFDLSPYRGQTVTLSFEADNCVPGAHFAYAYVALRDECAGLQISGPRKACLNTPATYSVPALADATYTWTVPTGWKVDSGAGTSTIVVTPGTAAGGNLTVHEVNSCADLTSAISVSATPPTVAGRLAGDATVCAGANTTPIKLEGQQGDVLDWYAVPAGGAAQSLGNTSTDYTATNLTTTTVYYALVRNGDACAIDTASPATVTVDPLSRGGKITPEELTVCQGQDQGSLLELQDQTGDVVSWQRSLDSATWTPFSPPPPATSYEVGTITQTTYYRAIVKSGVCPVDTSAVASTIFEPTPFPEFSLSPLSASLCYGDSVSLGMQVTEGTDYSWTPDSSLSGISSGTLGALPASVSVVAKPTDTTYYVLTVHNTGCPNARVDSVEVGVTPPIIVNAGNDTAIVAGQPLQLDATVNVSAASQFFWDPSTGLSATNIPDPVANLGTTIDTITYQVRATDPIGCYGEDSIRVVVFKTGADIFVPTAFTPNGDGMNDQLKPICVGISKLAYFRVYNRWGQLVFQTTQMNAGWNGRINGKAQPTGGYVYMAEGTDYNGKTVSRKGTSLLIR